VTEKTPNSETEGQLPTEVSATPQKELPDAWWYKIYLLVFVTTVIVIGAMVWFTKHFSN
jgi:hypothetical protein